MTATPTSNPAAPAVIFLGDCQVRLWGLDSKTRLARALKRAGIPEAALEVMPPAAADHWLLLRLDYLYEESLIRALLGAPGTVLTTQAGEPVAALVAAADGPAARQWIESRGATMRPSSALAIKNPVSLASTYNQALRKRAVPYLLAIDASARNLLERASFGGAYKGVTDFVTKYIWPWPARYVTRWCASLGITPNAVTFVSLLFVLAAIWFFARGDFLLGCFAAWSMTFLDTVDGKLARVTLTSSKWGNVFDHGIDLIHPPFWYWAWWAGLASGDPMLATAFWISILGYVAGRAQEGLFIWQFGFELHSWRRIDSAFRLITARRNPNLAILMIGALCGAPDLGLLAVAIWTVASFVFHCWRIGVAFWDRAQGRPPVSWLSEAL